MAKTTTGGKGLSLTAKLNVAEAIKAAQLLKKELASIGGVSSSSGKAFDTKPLTEYQAGILKIKQDALDLAKQKQAQAAADKSASLALQAALREERQIKQAAAAAEKKEKLEAIALTKQMAAEASLAAKEQARVQKEIAAQALVKKPAQLSNSQAEIDAYNNALNGSKEITSTLNEQNLAQAALANSATASGKAIAETDAIEKKAGLTKKQQAFLLAEEKYNQQQATKELKNNVREMNNAKGSLEQRRAALIRLQTVFDRMSVAERESPAGGRLNGVLGRLNDQVLALEKSTGRSQRNVGNYLTKAWGGLKLIAGMLPGVGLAGLLAFAAGPIIDYISQLGTFTTKLTQLKANLDAYNEVQKSANQTAAPQIANLKILYGVATDVNNAMKDRLAAALELKKEFPNEFANTSSLKIINGELSKSYDLVTASILEQAKAKAAANKITEIEAKKQDAEFQKEKINNARNNQLADYSKFQKQNKINFENGSSTLKPGSIQDLANIKNIKNDASEAYKVQNDLIKILDGQEAFVTKYAGGGKKIAAAIEGNTNLIKEPVKNFQSLLTNIEQKADADNLQAALQAKLNALAPNDKQRADLEGKLKQVELILKKYSPKVSDNNPKVDTALNARNSLQQKIDELTKKGTNKQLEADEQELESVRDKYRKMQEEAVKFNNNPENKKKGLRVDGGGLIRAQDRELVALRDRQGTGKLKVTLDSQKKLYDDFEAYKNEVGEENAKKRYAGLIDTDKTYLQSLKAQEQALVSTDEKAKGGFDVDTEGNKLKLAELNKRIADETNAERGKYDTLLKQLQSYQDQAKILTANYAKDQAEIAKNPLNLNADQLAEQYRILKDNFDKKISGLSVSELTDSVDWSNLFSNLDDLAVGDIEKLLSTIEGKFKDLSKKLTPIDLAATRKKLQEARDILIKDNPFKQLGLAIRTIFSDGADSSKKSAVEIKADWNNLAHATSGAFKFVNDAVESCDILKDAIGEVGTTALSSLSAIAQAGIATATAVSAASTAAAATAVATSAAIKTAEKASVILAVISLALVVVQAIASVFKSIFNAGDKRIEKTIQGYQDQLEALDKGFKQLERDVQRSVGESFYTDSLKEIENLNKQQALLQQQLDAERGKKHADQGKINSYQDKLNEIPNQIADIQQSITDMLVQTTFKDLSSSLADAFTDAFASGEDSLAKLNEAFNGVIANAVKKGLELKFLQPVVDGFIKDFAAYMNGNGNSAIGFDFNKYKDMLQVAGDSFTAGLEPFKDFFKPTDASSSSGSALNNSIKSITSDEANALEGIQRGQYDLTKQMLTGQTVGNTLLTGLGKSIGDIFNIATANLAHNAATAANTANTVVELKNAVVELKAINKNTTPGSMRGAGLG
jgi:hypothetical protein